MEAEQHESGMFLESVLHESLYLKFCVTMFCTWLLWLVTGLYMVLQIANNWLGWSSHFYQEHKEKSNVDIFFQKFKMS